MNETDEIAQLLMKLLREDPMLFAAALRDPHRDPRQNHIIHEEQEITDL